MIAAILTVLLFLLPGILAAEIAKAEEFAHAISALTDPAKLATIKEKRGATPRLWKTCYRLRMAQREGVEPRALLDAAQKANRSHGPPRADLLKVSLLRNLTILERLGCLDVAGIGKLRTGNAPTITKGPYKGELATADRIIPWSVCPELDNAQINLEFMPDTLNWPKADKVGGGW